VSSDFPMLREIKEGRILLMWEDVVSFLQKGTIVEKLNEEVAKDGQHLRHLNGICEGHILRSIYAIFRVASAPLMSSDLLQEFPNLCLAIWTTTPRTIPANAG
ncbi:isoleucine-tRNA ligase-like protein, partial [Trifolium pratense]